MKRLLIRFCSVIFTIMVALSCYIPAFAAEKVLTVNSDAKVNVGDTIKFSLNLSDCTEEIIGFEMRIFYDSNYLQFNKDSLTFDKFQGVIYNQNLQNVIPMSWTNISNGADFSKKGLLVSAEFKVIKEGETEISEFITDMYGDDMTYLKSYKLTYDITVNDEVIVSDKPPVVNDDEDTLKQRQGGFINYDDGMGDNSPDHNGHRAIISTEVVDVTRYEQASSTSSGNNTLTIFVIIGIVVVVLAVIAVVIVKKRDDAKLSSDTDNNESQI